MINVRNIDVKYGSETALAGLSLNVERNSTCAIIGPSGCGKTTLLYALAGILKTSSGRIEINGSELSHIRPNTGLILQNYGLLPWKTVWNNLAFPLKTRSVSKTEIRERVGSTLDILGIGEFSKKYPDELSGGQKQRVAIARSLVLKPDLLLMDEASSALDAITKEQIQDLILDIYKKNKMTLVFVTHNIEEAVFLGQKIVVMNSGEISKTIHNPCFELENLRTRIEFYQMCLEVRKVLDEDNEKF
ncbi:ABC transporter ATP-binding protein [Alkalibacter mobilis]|uniref:ABC transporter ATP-binding protein n=1 Tax=Alkalibacter mobilis TaxID=2787712 RepID=UPI00189D00A6|nr:ABC transporter ATP-binding protein [Alkalibacter mobilis]MBF7096767.1 ABC transporter ATP-binding protein [Alkalibacter mobilis]